MSQAIESLLAAQERAMKSRPKVGGFPVLAETLRAAGVMRNRWTLPSCQSFFETALGPVIMQGTPLVTGAVDVPPFDREALVRALRADQAGLSTFPEFLMSSWRAGVIAYDVDFLKRKVTYFGCRGEEYTEEYPQVEVN